MKGIVRSQYRLPSDVDRWLSERAKADVRSKNAQMIAGLRKLMALEKENAPSAGTGEALLTQ